MTMPPNDATVPSPPAKKPLMRVGDWIGCIVVGFFIHLPNAPKTNDLAGFFGEAIGRIVGVVIWWVIVKLIYRGIMKLIRRFRGSGV
jgi:hypothetical protein